MIGLGSEKNHMCNNLTLWLPALNLWLKPSHLHYIHPQVCVKWRIFFVLATRWWTVVVTDLGGNFNRGNFVPRHVTSTTLTFRALLIPRSLWSSLSSFCLLDCELFNFCPAHWSNTNLDHIAPFSLSTGQDNSFLHTWKFNKPFHRVAEVGRRRKGPSPKSQKEILSPNIHFFVAILSFVEICAFLGQEYHYCISY